MRVAVDSVWRPSHVWLARGVISLAPLQACASLENRVGAPFNKPLNRQLLTLCRRKPYGG